MAAIQPGWCVWSMLISAVLRAALEAQVFYEDTCEDSCIVMSRTKALGMLANAFLLNIKRGSALDFLGGGPDPLYVSGAKLAAPKLLCILSYLTHATGTAPVNSGAGTVGKAMSQKADVTSCHIKFVRARVGASELLHEKAAAQVEVACTLHSGLELHEAGDEDGTAGEGNTPPDSAREHGSMTAVVVSALSGRPFGGGPLQGSSATEEECMLLAYPEALLGLTLFATPAATDEVLVVHGVRRFSRCRGAPHELRFEGLASSNAAPTTILFLDASRTPGPAQFTSEHVTSQLEKAVTGLAALRADAQGVLECTVGLWGCSGFSGAQPILRTVLLLIAASVVEAKLSVCIPKPEQAQHKWYAGVLSELRTRAPTLQALRAMLSTEVTCRSERLSRDVPAFASYLIKTLRAIAQISVDLPAIAPSTGAITSGSSATSNAEGAQAGVTEASRKRARPPDLERISTEEVVRVGTEV